MRTSRAEPGAPETWPETRWRPLARAHRARVDAWTRPHLARRSRGERHPVEDFLWDYYSYSPAALGRWHPGWGVLLSGDVAGFADVRGWLVADGRARVDPALPPRRLDRVRWIRDLLLATGSRPAVLGCFGLHEWAMLYRTEHPRHAQLPLRLGSAGTDAVVETHRIGCTHWDAYRFFTPEAAPLNRVRPGPATRTANEQPGCLHAGMDVYKWAYQLAPFTSAELIADAFALARDIRVLDMRASPYDLTALGHSPVPIETPDGKAAYRSAQREFAACAGRLRDRLVAVCDAVLGSAAQVGLDDVPAAPADVGGGRQGVGPEVVAALQQ